MRKRIQRPSPALVVACIALFVALGGVGYAAATINGKDIVNKTVAGKKLKNKTVTGGKVKSNTLTGTQINESKLGKVPTAAKADSATNAATATNAGQLGGQPPAAYLPAPARSGGPTDCDPGDATFVDCATTTIPLGRSSRLLLNAQTPYHRDSGNARGICRLVVDGTVQTTSAEIGTSDAQSAIAANYGFGFTFVTEPLGIGTRTVTIQCNQTTAADIHYIGTTVSAIGAG